MKAEQFWEAILAAPADDAPRLMYADWLDEQGDSEEARHVRNHVHVALYHARYGLWPKIFAKNRQRFRCLIRSSPQTRPGPAMHGFIASEEHGYINQLVCPEHTFTGEEGRLTNGREEQRTGWYEPLEFISLEEAHRLLVEARWETEGKVCINDVAFEWGALHPDEFPGLKQHYPEVYNSFWENR
jgi:uncharacterized protein (TIGR02996 family)